MFYALDNEHVYAFVRKRDLNAYINNHPASERLLQREALQKMANTLCFDSYAHTFDTPWKYLQYMTAEEICTEYFEMFGGEIQ